MKSLFDFATKELSQDAFLRWLFESYADDDITPCVRTLLQAFCGLEDGEEILSIQTAAQWNNIDISIHITTSQRRLSLFIEDKVFSLGHGNQLRKYNRFLAPVPDVHRVYFKTSFLTTGERASVEEAGWNIYDIDAIFRLLEDYQTCGNVILRQYAEHIASRYQTLRNRELPKQNDLLLWESCFRNTIVPAMERILPDQVDWVVGTYQGVYAYLQGFCRGAGNVPYIEIRSRDCCYDAQHGANRFLARILCCGVEDLSPQAAVIETIRADGILSCKGIRKENAKQIGVSPADVTAADNARFVSLLSCYTEYYLRLMETWRSEASAPERAARTQPFSTASEK